MLPNLTVHLLEVNLSITLVLPTSGYSRLDSSTFQSSTVHQPLLSAQNVLDSIFYGLVLSLHSVHRCFGSNAADPSAVWRTIILIDRILIWIWIWINNREYMNQWW